MKNKSTNEPGKLAGTARVLREIREFAQMEDEYGQGVAISITARAIQRFDQDVTSADVRGAAKVLRALLTGKVSIRSERADLEARAEWIVDQFFGQVRQRKAATQG